MILTGIKVQAGFMIKTYFLFYLLYKYTKLYLQNRVVKFFTSYMKALLADPFMRSDLSLGQDTMQQ